MDGQPSQTAVLEGIRISYQSYGGGSQALVFIHGWTCNSSLWCYQRPIFERFRTLLIDLPGHGRSDAPEHTAYTPELFACACQAVLQQEGIRKAVLVGHSMGGPVSTMVLRLFPDLVSAIIYVDSFFHLPEAYMTQQQRKQLAQRWNSDEEFAMNLERFWSAQSSDVVKQKVRKEMRATPRHVRIHAVAVDCLPHALRWDDRFDIPALHIVTPAFQNVDRLWLHHMPNLTLKLWEQNGHFLFMEDPQRFNADVATFVEQHSLL